MSFSLTCDNGTIEVFNYSDEYICDGDPNPLRSHVIVTNLSEIVDKFK